ncbi:hypothetical protein EVAR_87410_1 [Eumeta japonica]|uniref:Uncharacterized protein n=1 Tax=Eumeta variegata TaxID=151549 RepID=A0A4C1XI03_EUMVA|nr:hypothetical protein EVAR_87410_1 [Eumeta japonica]
MTRLFNGMRAARPAATAPSPDSDSSLGLRSGHSTTLQWRVNCIWPLSTTGAPHRWDLSRHREGVRPSVALRIAVQKPGYHKAAAYRRACAVYTDDIPTLTDQLQHWEGRRAALYADDSAYLASSHRVTSLRLNSEGPRPIAGLAGQMACRRECHEDGFLTGQQRAYQQS